VQPWGLCALSENVPSEFSRSPFFESPCLTARLHPDTRFDISNSPPVGICRKPDLWVRRKRITRQRKKAVRSETVVGAGDIALRRCRTGSNGLLDDRPIQPPRHP
jgi:hypothetical protein